MKLLAITALLLFATVTCSAQDQKDWPWVNERFQAVLQQVMPIKEPTGESLGYRSYRDLYTNELECSFVFNSVPRDRHITAVLRKADSVSIYDQIMALHTKNPEENVDTFMKQLKVNERHLSEATCPAVRRQYDRFYELVLPMLSADDRAAQARGEYSITLHPRVHTFQAHISGGTLHLIIGRQDHPFAVWATETLSALENCDSAASENRKEQR